MPERVKPRATMFTPVLVLVVFLAILAARYLTADTLGLNENPYLAVVVIQLVTYAIPSVFYYKIRGRGFAPKVRLRMFRPAHLLYLLHTTVFLISGVMLLSILMYRVTPDSFATASTADYASFAMNQRFFDGAYLVLAFAVLPAATEEFLFRGIVLGEYERYGASVAAAASSMMFAMSHFSFARFPVYLFSGLVLACATYATRSVVAAAFIHALNNAAVLLCEKYVLNIVDKQNVSMTLLLILLGAAAILSAMLMCFEASGLYRDMAQANVPSDYVNHPDRKRNLFVRLGDAFLTPTFLLLVILFVAATMSQR
ncbi:MAG: lysostaphin resistance A-like protein [Eubacteriales bacterium]